MRSAPKKFIHRYAVKTAESSGLKEEKCEEHEAVPLQPTTSIIHDATVLPGTRRSYRLPEIPAFEMDVNLPQRAGLGQLAFPFR